ncbi:MAG: quinone-dependent dihydroorotate dehydrogenase [Chloroflexota bacterium]
MYKKLVFPVLRRFDPESVHDLTVRLLEQAQKRAVGRKFLRKLAGEVPRRPVEVFGLTFPNELGVAAGFDKDIRIVNGLYLLGFGHIEVGTLTPKPQIGNPRPRVFRLVKDQAIINRMGFPNCGVAEAIGRLQSFYDSQNRPIIGISLGKQKDTPLSGAVTDYKQVMKTVYPFADYLAFNISSPNTPGLRELQRGEYLQELLLTLAKENRDQAKKNGLKEKPMLLKIAPDLNWEQLDAIIEVAQENGISGIIATNTTLARNHLSSDKRDENGGLSGRPLRNRSDEIIKYIHKKTFGRLPIIGVGGIFNSEAVIAKLEAGATLVQVYTGLVYEGPKMAGRILRSL